MRKQNESVINMEPNLLLRIIKTGWRRLIQIGMKALVPAQCEIYCFQKQKKKTMTTIFFMMIPDFAEFRQGVEKEAPLP